MQIRWWIQLVNLATCCYNMGTIWMTQLGWRLWAHVGRDEFPAYHRAWWFGVRGIQPVIFPSFILSTLGSFAQLRQRPARVPAWAAWLGALLQVAAWVSTGAWWGRWQGQLENVRREDGSLDPLYERILSTHWARVALITASGLVQIGITARALPNATPDADRAVETPASRQ